MLVYAEGKESNRVCPCPGQVALKCEKTVFWWKSESVIWEEEVKIVYYTMTLNDDDSEGQWF